jgi:hypothetical protein
VIRHKIIYVEWEGGRIGYDSGFGIKGLRNQLEEAINELAAEGWGLEHVTQDGWLYTLFFAKMEQ